MANKYNCRQISEQEEKEIISYYFEHALGPTAQFFHISVGRVKNILIKYNINFLTKEQIEKIRQDHIENTCLALYGCTNGGGSKQAVEKIKKTKLSKYGDTKYNNISKNKQTCIEKYGVENVFQIKQIQDKSKKTMLARYGVTHNSKNPATRSKAKNTCIKKYGVENYSQTAEYHKRARKLYKYKKEKFDSFPELAVYIYAKDHDQKIIRNPIRFEYIYNNKKHYYFPDFSIDGKLIEIKGSHFFKEDGTMCNPFDHTQDELFEAKHQCGLINNVAF